jgi:hypothetical protein
MEEEAPGGVETGQTLCRNVLEMKTSEYAPPSGGRIVVHEMPLNDDHTGPFTIAAFNMMMLLFAS